MAKTKIDENLVAENVREIIEHLGVSATAEVWREDEQEGSKKGKGNPVFYVDINSEDSALLIGKNGANLESLQFILAVRLKTQTKEEDFEVYVDVDNWRKQKEEKLKDMALSIAQKVAETATPQQLYNLRPSERRVVHTVLTDHPKVTTISEGEGIDRYLIIKPK